MYLDLLTRIKNAQMAKKEMLKVPYTKIDIIVAELLAKHGYIDNVQKKGRMPKRVMEIKLKYENGQGIIQGIRFLSKPSRRLYAKSTELKAVRHGYGTGFVSTSKGIMTNQDARKQKLGGQLLFEIW